MFNLILTAVTESVKESWIQKTTGYLMTFKSVSSIREM